MNRNSPFPLTVLLALLCACSAYGATLQVPSQYATIQAGINAAMNGDTVLVADGTYTGPGNRNITFLGKRIVVVSENGAESCLIDCQNSARGFLFQSGEDSNSVLSGFTITHGTEHDGGGIFCPSGSPTISNCIITANSASGGGPSSPQGGGVYFGGSSTARMYNCIISQNSAGGGGGICVYGAAAPIIDQCTVSGNTAGRGGGIVCSSNNPNLTISNSTISRNSGINNGVGGIYYNQGGGILSNCVISDNIGYSGVAGGIDCDWEVDVLISHCTISGNVASWSAWGGGGLYCEKAWPTIEYSTFSGNSAWDGAGLLSFWSSPTLRFCTFTDNYALNNGGAIRVDGEITISNCTLSRNTAGNWGGAIIYRDPMVTPRLLLENSILEGNRGTGGIYFETSENVQLIYSDCYDNEGGEFAGSVAPPLGQLIGTNINGDSCDIFNNIFEDPLFADPGNANYQITWANFPIPDSTMSPCIDAGDPTTPYDPDGTIADMGAFYFDQSEIPPIEITLVPPTPPIIIPAIGGMFQYNVTLTNNDSSASHTFDVWIMTRLPNGIWHAPLFGPFSLTLSGGTSLSRWRTQTVPGTAPAGEYWYEGRVGDYPSAIWDTSGFAFTKSGSGDWEPGSGDWSNTGESFDSSDEPFITHHSSLITSINPNPFNPSTALSYELRDASFVKLAIYDISGRLVATLMDGWREAGVHEVTFDGTELPSGIYLYRITTGTESETGKMILLK